MTGFRGAGHNDRLARRSLPLPRAGAIVRGHLDGSNGRTKVEGWVPKWMAFPSAAYTERDGVRAVAARIEMTAPEGDEEPQRDAA